MKDKLLTRDQFREGCLIRDNHKCVVCGANSELSVHHIIERRLWDDGGYYMDNGATLCEEHHIEAETTELSCEDIRAFVGIASIALPDGYYSDHVYTKWGDVVLPNGNRMKGPLFSDDSVQKILKMGPYFDRYTEYVKYPRTYHLPWSEGATDDDKTIPNCSQFEGKMVVITEKMDGENTTLYRDYCHARSIDGRNHWSRSRVKNLQAKIGYEIPDGWRLCGENLYAEHSIAYDNLESYFLLFSIWDDKNNCLSWSETKQYAELLGLDVVPTLYEGIWDEKLVRDLYKGKDRTKIEGYVVRLEESFNYLSFSKSVAKFVRANHVNPENHHWMFTSTKTNKIKDENEIPN